MAFIDLRLDPDISIGAQGGPDWEPLSVVSLESGDESREAVKTKALGSWTIGYNARRPALWQRFQDFWYVVGGVNSWRYKDWLDFECSSAQAHLAAIDSTHWQMCKRRTLGNYTYDQLIILPLNTVVAGSGTYTASLTTGIITKTAGSAPTGFSCKYDKLARFVSGHLVQTIETRKNELNADGSRKLIVSYTGIGVKEIPLTSA